MQFSIVIPCFNESKNIKKLVSEIDQHLKNYKYEIILIDDLSTDDSISIIKSIRMNNLVVLLNTKNLGQSHSIFNGVKIAKSNTIVTIDGDGQNNPKDISKLFNLYISNDDVFLVGGLRKNRKDNYVKLVSSIFANYIRKLILKDNCDDTGCSLKVFDRSIFLMLPLFSGLHRFLPALFLGLKKNTMFVPVAHRKREFGKSKYGTFKRAINGIKDLFFVYRLIRKMKKNV